MYNKALLLRDEGLASAATLPTGAFVNMNCAVRIHCGTDCTAGEQLLERFRCSEQSSLSERQSVMCTEKCSCRNIIVVELAN